MHWHRDSRNMHLDFMKYARWNLQKMFTPPKSKSPWEAMTAGSTGGWAKGLEPWGPALTGAMGMLSPFSAGITGALAAGMGAAGMAGKGSGFQGTDKGWGNVIPTLLGGIQGYGLGAVGKGIGTGIQSMMGGMPSGAMSTFTAGQTGPNAGTWGQGFGGMFGSGFGQGVTNYTAPAAGGIKNMMGGIGNMFGSGAQSGIGNVIGSIFEKTGMGPGTQGGSPFNLNLGNVAAMTLGGAGSLLGGYGYPQLQRNTGEAMDKVYTPALQEARGMIRDLAIANPSELLGPASDEFLEATLRQSREAATRQKQETLATFAAQGKTPGKSGSVDKYLQDFDKAALQKENDFITTLNESRRIAAVNLKVKAVADYYKIAEAEAAQILAAEGYINPVDAQNYLGLVSMYNTNMQMNALQGIYG